MAVTVAGNSLILAAIWKETFEKTSFHILLSALALTDLLSGLVSQPLIGISILVPSLQVGFNSLAFGCVFEAEGRQTRNSLPSLLVLNPAMSLFLTGEYSLGLYV